MAVAAQPLGQHWTFGHALPASAPAPPSSGGFPIAPLALLCLGLTLLVIAATIVLSLIPVYLPARRVNPNCISDPFTTTFNVNSGTLSLGQLSAANQAALQSGENRFVSTQNGFGRCAIEIRNANVVNCPSNRLLLQKRRRRQQTSSGRYVRQTNGNCVTQQIQVTSVLNCGCLFIGRALNRRALILAGLLGSAFIPITFPEPGTTTVTAATVTNPTTSSTGGSTSSTAIGGGVTTTTSSSSTTTTATTTGTPALSG